MVARFVGTPIEDIKIKYGPYSMKNYDTKNVKKDVRLECSGCGMAFEYVERYVHEDHPVLGGFLWKQKKTFLDVWNRRADEANGS